MKGSFAFGADNQQPPLLYEGGFSPPWGETEQPVTLDLYSERKELLCFCFASQNFGERILDIVVYTHQI